jgi:hypothetical protein
VEQRLANLEAEVDALKRSVKSVRAAVQRHDEYIDTVSSALWKRLIWWALGFYYRKVGRWYAPDWTPKWPRGERS